ncbi:type VI secretion system Vgr family protein [Sorangium atrum]|uniref:Type VI secretion system tip protein TssI/VgrG n=1 Tax=Sorangium atrum TaxID=2995308 RepID=A0ABT5C4D9_9BACT|nr:type VI secretion system tip protein TssI/VgrG [Sorangium aterium]MDC0681286.1 type VI secretion system tip protein TssI/VgrG [Sorangium aterium]
MADHHVLAIPSLSVEGKIYRVLRFELTEQLSELTRLECELLDDEAALPRPKEVLGKRAVFTLSRSDDTQTRSFAGTIVLAELVPDPDDVPTLRIEVAPALWNLGQRSDCRIFQDKSAVDIVKEVLEGAGVPASQQDWRVTEPHPTRVYTVQYRERDLDFVHRLLAEEGIYFAIHMRDEEDVIVFGDSPTGLEDIEGATSLPFFQDFGAEGFADRVVRLSREVSVRSDKVFVRDYDPEKPSTKPEASAEGSDPGEHVLEIYEHPARTADAGVAERLAKVLLDSVQAERDVVRGESGSLALLPGRRFSVDGHPYDPLNQEYLVIRARIAGSRPRNFELSGRAGAEDGARDLQSICEFWGVPTGTTRYRPPRRAREQVIPGAQTAMTTGPSGQEIHTDAGGHVKVAFHWDRSGKKDDTSSRWIRTSQVPTGGSMLLPRVGWEVTVRHVEGDADRPFVMGRMYNALTPPPYALPKEAGKSSLQTVTTPGGGSTNELRMSDAKGGEEMFINASKDMSTEVKNNATESIGNNHKKKIGADQTTNVTNSMTTSVGSNQTLSVSGNQSMKIETFHVDDMGGDHSLSIGGNRDMKIGGDHKRDVTGNSSLTVSGNQIDLVVGSVTDQTLAGFNHEVGAALVELALGHRSVTVQGDRSETATGAKVIAVKSGRGVQVGGSMNVKVGGAIVNVANGNRVESSLGTYTELAGGAQLVKANNAVFEATGALTLVMGASILSLTPASVAIIGVSAKLDGDVSDTAALVLDN